MSNRKRVRHPATHSRLEIILSRVEAGVLMINDQLVKETQTYRIINFILDMAIDEVSDKGMSDKYNVLIELVYDIKTEYL